jgi:tetratricopeptide (TPR) repeat protein
MAHRRRGDWASALADANTALDRKPNSDAALNLRASVHYALGDYSAALADHEAALLIDANDPTTLNFLAWLYATCPEAAIRNGAKAIAYAVQACEMTNHELPGFLDTLAAAYAEAGRYEVAVKWMKKVLEIVPPDERDKYEPHLALYETGQPYRDV